MGYALTEPQRLLALPAFWLVRLLLLVFDVLGAATFGGCADGCGFLAAGAAGGGAERHGCAGLLATTAALNLFALAALALAAAIRWFTEERSYREACGVTYALVALELALKVADAALPMWTTASCFPDSLASPNGMTQAACFNGNGTAACPVGDFFATYALYAGAKTAVGVADIALNTGTLLRKPREWYRRAAR